MNKLKTSLDFADDLCVLSTSFFHDHKLNYRVRENPDLLRLFGNIDMLNKTLSKLEAERRQYKNPTLSQIAMVNMIEESLDLLGKQMLIERLKA